MGLNNDPIPASKKRRAEKPYASKPDYRSEFKHTHKLAPRQAGII